MSVEQRNASLDLLRRLPPDQVADNLGVVLDLVPDLTESLLSTVDQPLQIAVDKSCGKEYILCDYNRDGDSYRSPWSNNYDPFIDDGAVPSDKLRNLEIAANDAFDAYRKAYYNGGVSSVYCWDLDDGFAGCWVIKKSAEDGGCWDSIHIVDVHETDLGSSAHYKLVSTIMLHVKDGSVPLQLSGTLTRQDERDMPLPKGSGSLGHLVNMGTMIEDTELKMRESLDKIYAGKTHEVLGYLHDSQGVEQSQHRMDGQRALFGEMRRLSTTEHGIPKV